MKKKTSSTILVPKETTRFFTPKDVVKNLVKYLEEQNPGCFDNPNHTFIDLYVKSGLYIAEIVVRLFQSPKLKWLYPNDDRLSHIFAKQVYGLAPNEIIYNVALNFLLGFDKDKKISKHNLKQLETLPYAKAGTIERKQVRWSFSKPRLSTHVWFRSLKKDSMRLVNNLYTPALDNYFVNDF